MLFLSCDNAGLDLCRTVISGSKNGANEMYCLSIVGQFSSIFTTFFTIDSSSDERLHNKIPLYRAYIRFGIDSAAVYANVCLNLYTV